MNRGVNRRRAVSGIINMTFWWCCSCCCCCYCHTSRPETVRGLSKQDFLLTTQQFALLSKYQSKTLLQMAVFASGSSNKNSHLWATSDVCCRRDVAKFRCSGLDQTFLNEITITKNIYVFKRNTSGDILNRVSTPRPWPAPDVSDRNVSFRTGTSNIVNVYSDLKH